MMSAVIWGRALLLGALVGGACLVVGAGPAMAKPKSRQEPSAATLASSLVSSAVRARTPGAQARAMLSMMKALQIGVVTPAGNPLSLGGEPAAAGLAALYSSELGPLGASVTRAPVLGLDAVAATLTRAGLTLDSQGKPFPARLLRTALIAAVKDAMRNPRRHGSLLPLVLRQLGRAERPAYDLARAPAAAQIHLTGLQAWLMTADIEISVLRHVQLGALRSARVTAIAPTARPASALSDACQKYSDASQALQKAEEKAAGGKVGKFIAGKVVGRLGDRVKAELKSSIETYGEKNLPSWAVNGVKEYIANAKLAAKLAGTVLEGLHGSLLAASISVHTVGNISSLPTVHWYHQPGEPGHQLTFAVAVEMLDDYGADLIKCGTLAGFTFPPKGGISGVPVLWEQAEGKLTPDMGVLSCALQSIGCVTNTDARGVASVTFTPNTELFPGVGLQLDASGVVDGVAAYQSGAGAGTLGKVAQVLVPKFAGLRWRVTYHKEPTLSVRVVDQYDTTYTNQTESQYESTGTGALHFSLSSVVPLTRFTASDGTNIWTGSAPVGWDNFFSKDDNKHFGVGSDCNGANSTIDVNGSSPGPGQLTADSLTYDSSQGIAGLALTLHTSSLPTYLLTEIYRADKSVSNPCRDSTTTTPATWNFPASLPGTGLTYLAGGSSTRGPTVRITGWTPGPATTSGSGVYAYRDVSTSGTDAWGQPWSQHGRIEIIASPAS